MWNQHFGDLKAVVCGNSLLFSLSVHARGIGYMQNMRAFKTVCPLRNELHLDITTAVKVTIKVLFTAHGAQLWLNGLISRCQYSIVWTAWKQHVHKDTNTHKHTHRVTSWTQSLHDAHFCQLQTAVIYWIVVIVDVKAAKWQEKRKRGPERVWNEVYYDIWHHERKGCVQGVTHEFLA